MRKIFITAFLLISFFANAQLDSGRWGITVGTNQYYMDTDILSSRSNIGYSFGGLATVPISEYSEFVVEISYNRYRFDLLGRESDDSEPEWIPFYKERVNLSAIYDYDLFHFLDEDFALGLNFGPVIGFYNNIEVSDDSKEEYTLDPYDIDQDYLSPYETSEDITMNVFLSFGISARYRNLEAFLRYNKGITDPFRSLTVSSEYINITGKENLLSFQLNYYFGSDF